ncbi:MAG TPA: hypothetical protein H9734_02570 [Candidatus Fusicatenibacter merdavium]|uniref:Uncharacterized protein n=1 Tax=Candidatus Fusicatenibacter merdavium TaxID=2838600 RepID=A0A9D2BIG2_9FIRM|nr:hypothetical protein [Candidatus Fusicatenibacter merdavium]
MDFTKEHVLLKKVDGGFGGETRTRKTFAVILHKISCKNFLKELSKAAGFL